MGTLLVMLTVASLARMAVPIKRQPDIMDDYSRHPCARACEDDDPGRLCAYEWTLELYWTLSRACFSCPRNAADCTRPYCVPAQGSPRAILTANRVLPGPAIQVCEGDEVQVRVKNRIETGEGATIHWHGLLQRGTPHMDGVNLVTQCPIPFMGEFTYRFKAEDPGTHWWHSHAGLQRSDGLWGHVVVRQAPARDVHSTLYDLDLPQHVLSVTDWLLELTANRFAHHHHDDGDNKPASMLINGKGAFHAFPDPAGSGNVSYTPYAEFHVRPGLRYRFRVISAGQLNCPIRLTIDGHDMMVIASDGGDFDPVVVDAINLFSGERYDFILRTHNDARPGKFWIRAHGLADCAPKQAHQEAILRYEGGDPGLPEEDNGYDSAMAPGITLNPWNARSTDRLISVNLLNSTGPDDDSLREVPDKKFYLAMDFQKIDNFHLHVPGLFPLAAVSRNRSTFSPQINHLSNVLPPVPPLTQSMDIDEEEVFCNPDTVQHDCTGTYCECTHRLQVALGDVVELVLIDEGKIFNANHPMHLHGYKFRVIAMDRLGESTTVEEVRALDKRGGIKRKLTRAIAKDSVTVPDGGYTVVRFKADNPGVWMLHCHVEFHAAIGMGLVVQVGEPGQWPPAPEGFPTCNRPTGTRGNNLQAARETRGGSRLQAAPDPLSGKASSSFPWTARLALCLILAHMLR